jgi:AcrR family transcriptional regulator
VKPVEDQTTEERILAAARDLLTRSGFMALTTRAIAEAAGVNEVTLFRHFGSKERLLAATIDRMLRDLDLRDLRAPDQGIPLADDLQAWAERYLEHTLPQGPMILTALWAAHRDLHIRQWLAIFRKQVATALTDHLASRPDLAGTSPERIRRVSEMFYAVLFIHVVASHVGDRPDVRTLSRDTAAICAAALRSEADWPPPDSTGATPRVPNESEGGTLE